MRSETQRAKIPKPLVLEAYEIPLADGSVLYVGYRRLDDFPVRQAERLFDDFAATVAPR